MRLALKAYTLSGCMELMAAYADGYERLGGENIVFCEDRLTLIAERALTKRVGGTFRTSVTTFARFLKAEGKTLSKQGSVMLVGEVMTRLQREGALQCFTSAAGIAKNARAIYETLAQFAASQVTPALLKEGAEKLEGDTLKKKIADLALIYEGYSTALLSQGYLDESRYLTLLPKRIREEGCLRGKNVFFLGYASFTAQAKETIRAALETAQNVVGIFCAGEEELYTRRAFDGFVGVCKEFGETQTLDGGYALEGDAEYLRKGLFNPELPKARIGTGNVFFFEAEDKTLEAEYVATKIRRAMAENESLRYRDFAVLTSSATGYALPLKKAFTEYGIPYFLDEKKSMRAHPLSRFLLDALRVVKEGFSPSSVQALAQNYFFGKSDDYRNYLYKFANYRGGALREIKGDKEEVQKLFNVAALEEGRARVLLATQDIKARGYGRVYCRAIREILKNFEVEKRLETLDLAMEDVAQKGYLAQIYRALEGVLVEAEILLGGKEMTVTEFAAVLEDGFDAMEISLIPLKADAVFIGDITESRIEKVSHLFALGMTDEVPQCAGDTAIVSDKEIARLAEVKTLLEPTVAEVNLRARECVGLNLCTFTNKLYLGYPLSADGSEPAVSEIFRYVKQIFCAESGKDLTTEKWKAEVREGEDGESFEALRDRCAAPAPAVRQVLMEQEKYGSRMSNYLDSCSAVYHALKRMGILDAKEYKNSQRRKDYVSGGDALFFNDEGKIGPTSLEGYFSCPFGHFASQGLRLKEREEATVLAVDSGNFIHLLLQETAAKAKSFETEEELRKYAYEVGERLMKSSVYMLQQDTETGKYSADRLLKEGVDVAAAAYRQLKNSAFEVEQTEAKITGKVITGKVDRIDGTEKYVRVVDYKTGGIDDSPGAYYTGRKLQMQLYMNEIMGERIPAGVFYFPASVAYSDEDEGRYRMKGFLNGAEEALLAGDVNLGKSAGEEEGEKKKSEYFGAALKNDGRQIKVLDERTFRDFLKYGEFVAERGAKEIRSGYIACSPYAGACSYCKYGGMCGFDRDCYEERKEERISPAKIAEIAREEERNRADGGADGVGSAGGENEGKED